MNTGRVQIAKLFGADGKTYVVRARAEACLADDICDKVAELNNRGIQVEMETENGRFVFEWVSDDEATNAKDIAA